MAKRKSKGIRHCVQKKTIRGVKRCVAYASGRKLSGDLGDYGDLGRVAQVITIPGKGVRCKDERGKFTRCLAGDLGDLSDLGDLGRVRRRIRRTARRTGRRVSSRKLGEYISGKGYRCRTAKGQFKKCS